MSNEEITLAVEKREILGKQVRGLRREGQVPAVIHDHGKPSVHIVAPYVAVVKAYQQAGKHHPITVNVDKDTYLALIKDVDFDPRKHQVRHVVFNAIKADEKQQTEVPVRFIEDAEIPAEKAGLMVLHQLDVVEIEALPKDLIDELIVDPSGLVEIGDKVLVSAIKVPQGVTILTEADRPIATVEETPAQVSEEAETAEGEEGEATEGAEGEKPASEGESVTSAGKPADES